MRELIYVPIIHTEADLGSLAAAIESASASLSGEKRWARHRETVSKFWENVADYFRSCDGAQMNIYQDGLTVDGALSGRIIEEAARRGSRNHQIILDLIRKGAEIRKTEDPALLLQEYESYARSVGVTLSEGGSGHIGQDRERLMEERDRFIAKTINETLKEGEKAILFVGAYHNVLSYLASDILVYQLKDVERVRAYFRALVQKQDERRFERLAKYVAAPIPQSGH